MSRKDDKLEGRQQPAEGQVVAATDEAPELDWHRGFGRMIQGLLRRYAGDDRLRKNDGAAMWWNQPWTDADREFALRIHLD